MKATFFLCGVWVKQYPDCVKEIARRGHEIGNHSLTHPHMSRMDAIAIQKELSDLDDMLEELTGKRSTLFRAPFGEYNDTVIRAAHEAGYEVIQWSRDTVDWKKDRSAQTILDGVLKKLQSGDIILCHNNGYKIETYLPVLIETAQQKGFTFVTVSELLLSGETSIDNNGVAADQKGSGRLSYKAAVICVKAKSKQLAGRNGAKRHFFLTRCRKLTAFSPSCGTFVQLRGEERRFYHPSRPA